ncbi:MAG: T9SS type A sorting domain-containing protein, partial [Bacteroidota bacterium]
IEYAEVKLIDTLKKDKFYYSEFWVSLTRFCLNPEPDGIDGIGAYFSKDTLKYSHEDTCFVFNVIPQVHNPIGNIIDDTTNWVKISGIFKAEGGEDYITIGNFIRDENLHIYEPANSNHISYFFIDDVSVVEYDSLMPMPVPEFHSLTVYPNPVLNAFSIEIKGNLVPVGFEIFNTIGQLVYKDIMLEKTNVNSEGFAPGVYTLRFNMGGRMEYRRVVKSN